RGLGRAIAVRLAREGAAVCVNFVSNETEAGAVVEEIRSAGGRAPGVRADVGDPAGVRAMGELVATELAPVGVLVDNPAGAGGGAAGGAGRWGGRPGRACAAGTWMVGPTGLGL